MDIYVKKINSSRYVKFKKIQINSQKYIYELQLKLIKSIQAYWSKFKQIYVNFMNSSNLCKLTSSKLKEI